VAFKPLLAHQFTFGDNFTRFNYRTRSGGRLSTLGTVVRCALWRRALPAGR
jgi:hypothetical protein